MPGPAKTRIAADVHVQQIARPRPFVAVRRAPLGRRAAREPMTAQHLPDRLMRLPRCPRDQSRPPARRLAHRADPRRELLTDPARLVMRAARAILKPSTARALDRRRIQPAMPPP